MDGSDGADESDRSTRTDALEALRPLASTEVAVTPTFRPSRGVHDPRIADGAHPRTCDAGPRATAAIVACGGAMGGVLGPGEALYHRLGERWSRRGVRFVRVGYREPNNLDQCAHDLACGVELARDAGAEPDRRDGAQLRRRRRDQDGGHHAGLGGRRRHVRHAVGGVRGRGGTGGSGRCCCSTAIATNCCRPSRVMSSPPSPATARS